jgi:hypothetical protein
MRDQQYRLAGLALDPHQFDIHALARHCIERAERNRNGRTHAAFSALATPLSPLGSATRHSVASDFLQIKINSLDKYCPAAFLRQNCLTKVAMANAGAYNHRGLWARRTAAPARAWVPARSFAPKLRPIYFGISEINLTSR